MELLVDLDSRKFLQVIGAQSEAARVSLKRGDSLPLELSFVRDGARVLLSDPADIRFALRAAGDADGAPVAYTGTFTRPTDESGIYRGTLNLNTVEANALLGIGTDVVKSSVLVLGEVTWSEDAGASWKTSGWLNGSLDNDLIKGDEVEPEEAVERGFLSYNLAQSLTQEEKDRLAANWPEAVAGQQQQGAFIDFDNSEVFADASEVSDSLVNLSNGNPLRINVDRPDGQPEADYLPVIENGGLRPVDQSIVYLGGQVAKVGEVFSVGVDFTVNEGFADAVDRIFLNVTYADRVIQDEGGIYPVGTAHFNMSKYGVNQASIFSTSGDLAAVNRSLVGDRYPWDREGKIDLKEGNRYTLILRAWDEFVELEISGIGSVLYRNAGFADLLGPEMYFWVEPFGAESPSGGQLINYATIHRVWAMDEARNSRAGRQNTVLELKQDLVSENGLAASLERFDVRVAAKGSEAFAGAPANAKRRFLGSGVYVEGGEYWGDVGLDNAGVRRNAVAGMYLEAVVTDRLESSAGAETTLLTAEGMNWLEPGECEIHEIFGVLGTGAKRITVGQSVYVGNVIFDSNAGGTPLDALSGAFELKVTRFHHASMGFRYTAKMTLPDGTILMDELSVNDGGGRGINDLLFKTTTADAAGISIDGLLHKKIANKLVKDS